MTWGMVHTRLSSGRTFTGPTSPIWPLLPIVSATALGANPVQSVPSHVTRSSITYRPDRWFGSAAMRAESSAGLRARLLGPSSPAGATAKEGAGLLIDVAGDAFVGVGVEAVGAVIVMSASLA